MLGKRFKIFGALFASALAIGTTVTASERGDFIAQDNRGEADVVLTYPTCVPNCTKADQEVLLQQGTIENMFVDAIRQARESVDFSMFTFGRTAIYEALLDAHRRGVKVRGVVDRAQFSHFTQPCTAEEACNLPPEFNKREFVSAPFETRIDMVNHIPLFKELSLSEKLAVLFWQSENGSQVRSTTGKQRLVHNKFVLVDKSRLLNGSGNWSITAVSVNLENIIIHDAHDEAETVGAFSCAFEAMWNASGSQPSSTALAKCQTDKVFFTPALVQGRDITDAILEAIANSKTLIEISMHHLTLKDIYLALEMALARGVKVRILHDDDDCMIKKTEEQKSLESAGAEVRYMPTSCQLFQLSHNKFGIFDDRVVINGAGNWSVGGLINNYENFVVMDSPSRVEKFNEFFETAFSTAVPRTECECNPRESVCRERYCIGRPMN